MIVTINYRDKRPIYKQITDSIKEQILSGVLKPDEQLTSVRQLAMEININPNTIAKAYAELERSGIIYSAMGRGYFVNNDLSEVYKMREAEISKTLQQCVGSAVQCGMSKEKVIDVIEKAYTEIEERERKEEQ